MGGNSRINFNIHLRGHVATDYLSWKSGQEWSEQDVLYYFNKYEKVNSIFNSKYLYIKHIYIYNSKNYNVAYLVTYH